LLQASESARILIAGQAPGRKAHVSGLPFDDPSGDRLRQWLGVDRATFYDPARIAIVPMAFCFPGTSPSGDLAPPPLCAESWRDQLLQRLPRIELTLVLGQYATQWHLPGHTGSLTQACVQCGTTCLTCWSCLIPARATIAGSRPIPGSRTKSCLRSVRECDPFFRLSPTDSTDFSFIVR